RHLPREHLDVAGAEQSGRRAGVANRRKRALARVPSIEGHEVEAPGQLDAVGDEVAVAAGDAVRRVVTALTRVRVGTRDTVESASATQRMRPIRERHADSCAERTSAAILFGPVRGEELPAILDQRRK